MTVKPMQKGASGVLVFPLTAPMQTARTRKVVMTISPMRTEGICSSAAMLLKAPPLAFTYRSLAATACTGGARFVPSTLHIVGFNGHMCSLSGQRGRA